MTVTHEQRVRWFVDWWVENVSKPCLFDTNVPLKWLTKDQEPSIENDSQEQVG